MQKKEGEGAGGGRRGEEDGEGARRKERVCKKEEKNGRGGIEDDRGRSR